MKLKSILKNILQHLLGMRLYLKVFAVFIIKTLPKNKNEGDFLYFLQCINTKGLLLDIGANIGVMSYYMAKKFPEQEVHSFEPIPINYSTLSWVKNHYNLTNVHMHSWALGNESGQIELVMPKLSNVNMQGLAHVVHESIPELNKGDRFQAPIYKLDDLDFLQGENKVAAIKLDVENFEYFVLKGGENLLRRDHPIVYSELWDNENRIKVLDLMQSLDYGVKVLINNQLVRFDPSAHNTQNFFFLPKDSKE